MVIKVPSPETLVLHWSFDNVTGTGASSDGLPNTSDAKFLVEDISSGSLALTGNYGWLGPIRYRQYPGQGDFFLPNELEVVNKEYIPSAKQNLPEVLNSFDFVEIRREDDDLFTRNTRPTKFFFSAEKSPYTIISEEIINLFATIKDFNNLIGQPVNRYRQEYKELEKLRDLYFSRIENSAIEPEKFFDYFKWIDSSISQMLGQLVPASAKFSPEVRNIIESHILERNKYWNKLPTLEFKIGTPEGGIKGVYELNYSWRSGSAPISNLESANGLWWNKRAERRGVISSGRSDVDATRTSILSATLSVFNRELTTPVRLNISKQDTFVSGAINLPRIKNIRNDLSLFDISSSVRDRHVPLGNYARDYEVVNTSGRSINNKYLVKSLGTGAVNLSSFIAGVVDFALPNRDAFKNKYIFVERFSAPGGAEVMSRGSLDSISEEFSAYNDSNARNSTVRTALNTTEKIHALQFGYNAESSSIPNYRKVNRNTERRIEFSGTTIITATNFDNNFVHHSIPRSDLQTYWISSSALTGVNQPLGFITNQYVPSGSLSIPSPSITFISASEILSVFGSLGERSFGYAPSDPNLAAGTAIQPLAIDFANTNQNIYEPITSSQNKLGYSTLDITLAGVGRATINYLNGSFVQQASTAGGVGRPGPAAILNAILLHRNGKFGLSSWKQTRQGQHPIARFMRQNSVLSILEQPPERVFLDNAGNRTVYRDSRGDVFTNYIEPYVSFKHKPLQHSLLITGNIEPVGFTHTYGNNLRYFANEEINNKLGLKKCDPQIYDNIKKYYLASTFPQEQNPVQGFVSLEYTENIFPNEKNVGLGLTRNRPLFTEEDGTGSNGFDRAPLFRRTFWKDDEGERLRDFSGTAPLNSMGVPDFNARSVWPMGRMFPAPSASSGENPFGFSQDTYADVDPTGSYLEGNAELNGINLRKLLGYNWRLAGTGNVHPFPFAELIPTASQSFTHYFSHRQPTGGLSILGTAYEHPPQYFTDIYSGKKPFYDTYDDFAVDVRPQGQGYSILPEFRISDHMKFYIDEMGGNFRARKDNILRVEGSVISSSASSSIGGFIENFFKTYSHSDFMKFFDVIVEDHTNTNIGISRITLKANVIKKLLPYNGFYPMSRCLQLGSLFSQSLGAHIGGIDWKRGQPTGGAPQYSGALAIQSLLQPFFAPGILYNSIKAGIAVDFPAFTGTFATNTGIYINDAPSFRFPFESLVDIASYLPVSKSDGSGRVFYTPDPTITLSTLSGGSGELLQPYFDWDGTKSALYELAMHNYLAESTKFFLKNRGFTTFTSKPSYTFAGSMVSGNSYYMDIDLFKTDDLVMFESYWTESGPHRRRYTLSFCDESTSGTTGMTGRFYGPPFKFTDTSIPFAPTVDPASAPYEPTYQYGVSTARIKYTSDGQETADNVLSRIFSKAKIEFITPGRNKKFADIAGGEANFNMPAYSASQLLSSSVNIFGKTTLKNVEYNTEPTFDGGFAPRAFTDQTNQNLDAWVISPKFETPILNFSSQPSVPCENFITSGFQLGLGHFPRGIWSGYGEIPTGSAGIYLALRESFPAIRSIPTSGAIVSDADRTGSLIQVCGFEASQKRIGEIADTTEISEAIVAIPFTDFPIIASGYAPTTQIFGKNFFSIPRETFNFQKNRKDQNLPVVPDVITTQGIARNIMNTSITDLYEKMTKFVIPPEINFLTYEDINPFVMYIFEFNSILDKQDLADIYQGLMPKIATTAENDEMAISHTLDNWEFFGGNKLPPEVRWFVFKVKRKAEKSYWDITADSRDDDRFKFSFQNGIVRPDYSWNYPYDFCSLIELGKIDTTITFEPKSTDVGQNAQSPPQLSVSPIRKTNIIGKVE